MSYSSHLLIVSIISLLVCFVHSQKECQLCMKTYHNAGCLICYNQCSQSKQMISCTSQPSNTTLSANTCLPTCCKNFSNTITFTEQMFNLCIQRDAFVPNDINIGLTLGLILGLGFILSLAGLAYELGIIQKINNIQDSNEGKSSNNFPTIINLQTKRETWQTDKVKITGICSLCQQSGINMVVMCGEGFHYGCLAKYVSNGGTVCPVCKLNDSLEHGKIYCSKCKQMYQDFNRKLQEIDERATSAIHQRKCPNCQ